MCLISLLSALLVCAAVMYFLSDSNNQSWAKKILWLFSIFVVRIIGAAQASKLPHLLRFCYMLNEQQWAFLT